jgi:hypothetical protein
MEPGATKATYQESAVAVQKERALELWKVVRDAVDIDELVADMVTEKLKNGLVPPVFHAYCALSQRKPVTENTMGDADVSKKAIELRADEADVRGEKILGSCPPSANMVTAGKVGVHAMLDGGLTGVDSFFDSSGNARIQVRDSPRRGIWTFDELWTETVCKLLNSDAKMVGADVEVTKVDSDFNMGTVDGMSTTHLITRRLSRGVVAECLKCVPRTLVPLLETRGLENHGHSSTHCNNCCYKMEHVSSSSWQRVVLHWPVLGETTQCTFGAKRRPTLVAVCFDFRMFGFFWIRLMRRMGAPSSSLETVVSFTPPLIAKNISLPPLSSAILKRCTTWVSTTRRKYMLQYLLCFQREQRMMGKLFGLERARLETCLVTF